LTFASELSKLTLGMNPVRKKRLIVSSGDNKYLSNGVKIILANNLILFMLAFALFFGAMSFSLSRVLYRINN